MHLPCAGAQEVGIHGPVRLKPGTRPIPAEPGRFGAKVVAMSDLHVPKLETFDVSAAANVDPKGFVRGVDVFETHPHGLYMGRGADHPQFGYLESWLLPDLGLRANIFHFRPGVDEPQDFYFDVADIERGAPDGGVWTTRDLYVDLVSVTGDSVDVLDIDELSAACAAGLISARDTEVAVEATLTAVEGITRHDDDAMAWLTSLGYDVTWAEHVELAPEM